MIPATGSMRIFLARLRATELQLLITVLLFFAAGYLLVVAVMRSNEFVPTLTGLSDVLWPSVLPFLLFLAVSLALSWRAPTADQLLLPLVALLAGMGLMMIARMEPSLEARFPGFYTNIDARQSLWVTLGIAVMSLILFAPWDTWFRRTQRMALMDWLDHYRYVWLAVGLLLIGATFAFGVDPNGSGQRAWLRVPGLFDFQPSELLKIILVMFLASYLNEHRELVMRSYRLGPLALPPLPYLIPLLLMWVIAMGLIVAQRDLGAALLLFGVFLAMLYVATGNAWYVVGGLGAFGVGAYLLYQVVAVVQTRVSIWLDPWATAQGTGYQIIQAIYSLSSGGVFGAGLGRGVPAVIPAAHTDFIFTAIGEELGLAGTLGILIAYALLVFRGLHIALAVPGRFRGFEQLMAIGLTTILAIQMIIIIGGNLRLIPLTGITLPFISYGGSSVLMNFVITGLLLRISAVR